MDHLEIITFGTIFVTSRKCFFISDLGDGMLEGDAGGQRLAHEGGIGERCPCGGGPRGIDKDAKLQDEK